jgi:hypothetical protein
MRTSSITIDERFFVARAELRKMSGRGSHGSGDKLSLDDLAKIIEDVHDAVDKWHNIGIQLGLHESELKSIESNYPRQNDRLREMICKWLQNKVATWGKMVSALKSRTVGEGYLAEQLESKYCVPLQRMTLTATKISKSTKVSASKSNNYACIFNIIRGLSQIELLHA